MLGMEVPIRTPTSFLFFAASGFAAYFAGEMPALRWWAYSAFSLFVALGPTRWVETCIYSFQAKRMFLGREEWVGLDEFGGLAVTIGWLGGIVQVILFVTGSFLGLRGLLEL